MLLVPLDRQRHWYRCHHLLGELLRAELERTEPEVVSRLHDRAATWFEANGQPASALDHAQAAGDADRAARLFGHDRAGRTRLWSGRHGLPLALVVRRAGADRALSARGRARRDRWRP